MDISDLEIFRAVVDAGGITRAAERLHRVPSNVTTRVRQFEEELGVALFIRENNRLRLSPAGKTLLGYAERILSLAQEAQAALQDAVPRGLLSFGAMESTAAIHLPGPIAEYHRRFPSVTLELHTGSTSKLERQVLSGELEAALVADPAADPRIEIFPIYEEELVLVAGEGHLSIQARQDACGMALLTFAPGCAYRRRLESWFRGLGQIPDRVVELGSYHAMLGCVAAGMGVALLPRSVLESHPQYENLSIHPLPPDLGQSTTALIWRKHAESPRVTALRDLLTSKACCTPLIMQAPVEPG